MKKWDLKSTITVTLVIALELITLFLIGAVVFGAIGTDNPIVNPIVLLFSNSVTMVLTYFFTKKEKKENEQVE